MGVEGGWDLQLKPVCLGPGLCMHVVAGEGERGWKSISEERNGINKKPEGRQVGPVFGER